MIKYNTTKLVKKSQWSASINLSKPVTDYIINKDSINKINWSLILKDDGPMCLITFNDDDIPKNFQTLYYESKEAKLTNSDIYIPMIIINLLKIKDKTPVRITHHIVDNKSVICLKVLAYCDFTIDRFNKNPLISFMSKIRKNNVLEISLPKGLRKITDIKNDDILTWSAYTTENDDEYKFIIEKLDNVINYPKNNKNLVYRTIEKVHKASNIYCVHIPKYVNDEFSLDSYEYVYWDVYQDNNRKFYIEILFS